MNTDSILNKSRTIGFLGFIFAAVVIISDKIFTLLSTVVSIKPGTPDNKMIVDWSMVVQPLLWAIIVLILVYEGSRAVKHKQFFIFDKAYNNLGITGALLICALGFITLAVVSYTHLIYWYSISYSIKYPWSLPFDLLILLALASETILIRNKLLNESDKEKRTFNLIAEFGKVFQWIKTFAFRIVTSVVIGWIIINSFFFVPEGGVAIIANGGQFNNNPPIPSGVHIKIPFWQEATIYRQYNYVKVPKFVLNGQPIEISYSYQLRTGFEREFLRHFATGHEYITFDVHYRYLASLQHKLDKGTINLDEKAIKQGLAEYLKALYSTELGQEKTVGWLQPISILVIISK